MNQIEKGEEVLAGFYDDPESEEEICESERQRSTNEKVKYIMIYNQYTRLTKR